MKLPERADSVPSGPVSTAFGYRVGDVVAGKYELLRTLGSGGMGAVWAVQNLVLDAQFALKLIKNEGGDLNSAERVLREARAAAHIEHPAIVRVIDFGTTDLGDPYLVMELLSGVTLRERLRQEGRLTPIEVVKLLLPIADALSVAHARGIVHRDLKPDNVICGVGAGGRCQPKLIDFGIAKEVDQSSARLTQSGTVIGSPEYMSPEQARGLSDVDHKTDIWGFAVMLYEMITGTTPFYSEGTIATVLHAVAEEPARPISEFGIQDPVLWSILARGLQKFPDARWPDMRAFGTALAKWLMQKGIEEDASAQSLRVIWLPDAPKPSLAPSLRAAHSAGPGTSSRFALYAGARDDDYQVPKRGIFRSGASVAAAAISVALIAIGSTYSALRHAPAPPIDSAAGARSEAVAPAPSLAPPPPIVTPVPAASVVSPTPDVPSGTASSEVAPPKTEPTSLPPPPASVAQGESLAGSVEHATRAIHRNAPRKRAAVPDEPQPVAPLPSPAPEESASGNTQLPDLKEPPEFDEGTPGNKPAPNAPDNPYIDDSKTAAPRRD